MAEEVKKSRPAPDPNSAKFKLGQIAAKAYSDAMEAKKRGEMVGWCASNFPVEIPETLGLYVCYPENQAAGIAARGGGERMCNEAEGDGYSNDICAYARISLAYAKLKSAPEQDMPMPDFVLCCNNICNCMIKWYENLAKELNITREHCARQFKEVTGVTVFEYLSEVRLMHAYRLLTHTRKNIADIAMEVGFSDFRAFRTCFMRVYQMTPSEYREKMEREEKNVLPG